jgi:hypothetical protein
MIGRKLSLLLVSAATALVPRPGSALEPAERRCLPVLEVGVRERHAWVKHDALHFGLLDALCTPAKQITVATDDPLTAFGAARDKLCHVGVKWPAVGGLQPEEYVLLAKSIVAPVVVSTWSACLALTPPSEGSELRIQRAQDSLTIKARFTPSTGASESTLRRDLIVNGASCAANRFKKGVHITGQWLEQKCHLSSANVVVVFDSTAGGVLRVLTRRDVDPDETGCFHQRDEHACQRLADRIAAAAGTDVEAQGRAMTAREAIIAIRQMRNYCESPAYGPSSPQCRDVWARYQQLQLNFQSPTDSYDPDHPFGNRSF